MKIRFLFGLLFATITAVQASSRTAHPNALAFSLGGRGLLYTLTYDRMAADWVGIGGGLMYYSGIYIVPFYLNFYPVRGFNSAFLITVGEGIVKDWDHSIDVLPLKISRKGVAKKLSYQTTFGIGYEYRKRFLFRMTLYGFLDEEGFYFPWGGLTFGSAF